jgi:hypothetical protein
MLTRRHWMGTVAILSVVPMAVPAVAATDPWVRLFEERAALLDSVAASEVDGNIPDLVSEVAWPRLARIETAILNSSPTSPAGLRAAIDAILADDDLSMQDQPPAMVRAVLRAARRFVSC